MKTFTVMLELNCDCGHCRVDPEPVIEIFMGDSEKECVQKAKEKGWEFRLFTKRTTAPGHF